MIATVSAQRYWERSATLLRRQINVAVWLAAAAPTGFFVASGFAVLFYALRRSDTPLMWAWLGLSVSLIGAAVVCWWRVRGKFFAPSEACVLLESRLKLDARLTAASLGLVAWPQEPLVRPAILQWRLGAPLGWTSAAVALLVAAVLAPVSRSGTVVRPSGPPPSLLQTQEMLSSLKQAEVVDPQTIQQLEERVATLARRPTDEQYSHSALEAADALRDQTAASASALARSLDSAASALRSANGSADMKGPAGRLAAALEGLANGAMPANPNLLSGLPGDASGLGQLTPQQREQLAQALSSAGNKAGGVAGAAGAGAPVAEPDPNGGQPGDGNGEGNGKGRWGKGGPGGGGESAPLMLNSDASVAGDGKNEALSGEALKRFALGDKLGTSVGSHVVDPKQSAGPVSAGAAAAPASGGEAVWVNRLTPAERAALKEFFK